jgi:hypothetical protein
MRLKLKRKKIKSKMKRKLRQIENANCQPIGFVLTYTPISGARRLGVGRDTESRARHEE